MKFFIASVALVGLALPSDADASINKCVLINLQENEKQNVYDASNLVLNDVNATSFDPTASDKGWNIKCRADKKVNYFKYAWEDGAVDTDYNAPCIDGDTGAVQLDTKTRSVTKLPRLADQCGATTVTVEAHTFDSGDKAAADTKKFTLEGKPEPPEFYRCHLCRRCKSMRYHTTGEFPIPFTAVPELVVMNRKGEIVVNATMEPIRYRPGRDYVDQYWLGYEKHVADVADNGVYMRSKNDCGVSKWRKCSVGSPIALDLDNSGEVEHIFGDFDFDLSGNGIPEHLTEWFAPSEGILVDSTRPGFDDGNLIGVHLYGDLGGLYDDGYDKLALHDFDNDGYVSGEELDGIEVWIDGNSNAKLDNGELSSLESHGVVSLALAHDEHYISYAILKDGSKMMTQDKWFAR